VITNGYFAAYTFKHGGIADQRVGKARIFYRGPGADD
jgi:hypothetical protein